MINVYRLDHTHLMTFVSADWNVEPEIRIYYLWLNTVENLDLVLGKNYSNKDYIKYPILSFKR